MVTKQWELWDGVIITNCQKFTHINRWGGAIGPHSMPNKPPSLPIGSPIPHRARQVGDMIRCSRLRRTDLPRPNQTNAYFVRAGQSGHDLRRTNHLRSRLARPMVVPGRGGTAVQDQDSHTLCLARLHSNQDVGSERCSAIRKPT